MYVKSYLLVLILWLFSTVCYSQTYTYSYTDPCTGNLKTFVGNTNGITLTVYGQTRFFTPNDFSSGNTELWLNSIVNSFGGSNPCATLVGTTTAINIAQNTTIQFLTIINNLSAASEMSGSIDLLSNVTSVTNNSDSKKHKKDKKSSETNSNHLNNTNSNSTSSTNNNVNNTNNSDSKNSVNISSNSTNQNSSDDKSSTNTSNTNNNNSNYSSNNSEDKVNNPATNNGNITVDKNTSNKAEINNSTNPNISSNDNKSGSGNVNMIGSSVNSLQSVGNSNSKNGNKPTILASSDFVGFNFKNTDVTYGGRFSSSYTSTRWDGLRSHGIIGDYTTAIKGPNIAGFYAFLHKKRIDLISTSLTIGFDRKISVYGTLAVGQMWKFKNPKNLKLVYLVTSSYGRVYDQEFFGTAFIAGGMYDRKISKRIDVKLLGLYVYAPYVRYYNDVLLKSPNVVLPIIGTNIGITKRFKFNLNMGGAYAININTLNYTIMMGTRLLL